MYSEVELFDTLFATFQDYFKLMPCFTNLIPLQSFFCYQYTLYILRSFCHLCKYFPSLSMAFNSLSPAFLFLVVRLLCKLFIFMFLFFTFEDNFNIKILKFCFEIIGKNKIKYFLNADLGLG